MKALKFTDAQKAFIIHHGDGEELKGPGLGYGCAAIKTVVQAAADARPGPNRRSVRPVTTIPEIGSIYSCH